MKSGPVLVLMEAPDRPVLRSGFEASQIFEDLAAPPGLTEGGK